MTGKCIQLERKWVGNEKESKFNERGKELTGKCIQLERKRVGNEEESKFNEGVQVGNKKGKCLQ